MMPPMYKRITAQSAPLKKSAGAVAIAKKDSGSEAGNANRIQRAAANYCHPRAKLSLTVRVGLKRMPFDNESTATAAPANLWRRLKPRTVLLSLVLLGVLVAAFYPSTPEPTPPLTLLPVSYKIVLPP